MQLMHYVWTVVGSLGCVAQIYIGADTQLIGGDKKGANGADEKYTMGRM